MQNTTPAYATIETIRDLQLIPERMYKTKLLVLFLFDSSIIFLLLYWLNLRYPERIIRFLEDPVINMLGLLIVVSLGIVLPLLALIFGPRIVYLVFSRIKLFLTKLFKLLNPFSYKYGDKKGTFIFRLKDLFKGEKKYAYDVKRKEEEQKRKKLLKKTTPFLILRDSWLGIIVRKLAVPLHGMFYLYLFFDGDITTFIGMRDENIYAKIFTYLLILSPIVYLWLSRQPKKAHEVASEKLKTPFKYYYSPGSEGRLSLGEFDQFEKHFRCEVSKYTSHRKGHYKEGIYHNQEFTYTVTINVEDLDLGFKYRLTYPTNSNFESWGTPYNKEYLTKKGMFDAN